MCKKVQGGKKTYQIVKEGSSQSQFSFFIQNPTGHQVLVKKSRNFRLPFFFVWYSQWLVDLKLLLSSGAPTHMGTWGNALAMF